MAQQKIVPNIWCNRTAEQAGAFYAAAFGELGFAGAQFAVEGRYPEAGLPEFQRDFAGQPIMVSLTIAGYRIGLINAGADFHPNPSLSFIVNFDPLLFGGANESTTDAARAALDRVWAALGEGGRVLMPLDEYFFSAHYGWVQDRYGVGWQLSLTDPAGDPRPFLMPALTFGNRAQNRAAEAAAHYLEVFAGVEGGTAAGLRVPYGAAAGTGPALPDSLIFADLRIGDQWFALMDAGAEREETFDCGVSLAVNCADQAEIDRLWDALSAAPEAEQCGWLADRFGVSWQIIPANFAELMQRPSAYAHMMQMKKLVIDDF
ncbi:MAG: VOC family protein [Frankiaceae bacterium]|nr:VOC family protein [Frankiaceae bacterium]